jgi:BirA family biotin operon repressor/biotin-[acetyl-CoA-carboxylase] ligase
MRENVKHRRGPGLANATATEVAALERAGRRAFADFRLTTLATTTSTQDVVRAAARGGAASGYSCMSDAQTAGRGRQDRRWTAPPGTALLCSTLVHVDHQHLGGVALAAGLAMRAAVALTSGQQPEVKWPNDIVVGRRKLGGVLCEVEPAAPGRGTAVSIGIGVNLRVPSFPAGVAGISLHELVPSPPSAVDLFATHLGELAARLAVLELEGVAGLREEWTDHAIGLGEPVVARSAAGAVSGIAVGIDEDGALLVRTASGPVRVLAGDVHLDAAPAPDG